MEKAMKPENIDLTSLLGLNSQQQRCSQGKRERERDNMKCWRGSISKDHGEVSEGDRVHSSSANAYLSPALYKHWASQ